MSLYRPLFDHVLTRVDAEVAHRMAFAGLRALPPRLTARVTAGQVSSADRRSRRGGVTTGRLPGRGGPTIHAMGLELPGPLGLAAGFDKNGEGIDALAALGFSFVEVGTVTARPQPGNPRPRLFRLPADRAIVNRMGFNNHGAEAVAARMARRAAKPALPVVVGVNIGKSKVVPETDDAAVLDDYRTSTRLLAPYADYLVVNVSSPNTPGLRTLQATDRLGPLLTAVREEVRLAGRDIPLLVKIAPDLADDDVLAVADLAVELSLEGIVATNTTVSRQGLHTPPGKVAAIGDGGLSGAPLASRSRDVLRLLRDRVPEAMTLVSVGGIFTAADIVDRLDAGATLVQAYSAFVYEGGVWPSRVQRDAAALRPAVTG